MNEPLISIILPVHNQADHIGDVVAEYEEALARVNYPRELLLVVNGSTDESWEACRSLAERFPTVRPILNDRGGWGLAVQVGLRAARGDLLCYTNSARTSAPDLVLMILYAIANPGTLVKPHRYTRDSFVRKLGSFLFNLECRKLFGLATWDINATPKVLPRELYDAIQPKSEGDLIDLEVYVKCRDRGTVILELPILSWHRHGGESTTSFRSAARMYWGAYQMLRAARYRAQ